jgi:hypothetical protein
MYEYYIAIDNGTTGTIGIIGPHVTEFFLTPVIIHQNYTAKWDNITRIDWTMLREKLKEYPSDKSFVLLERPMVNPQRFSATITALRAFESTLMIVESLKFAHAFIDSKEWQKKLLPEGTRGTEDLKKESMKLGCKLFPHHCELIRKHKDADGLLIAEYCRSIL